MRRSTLHRALAVHDLPHARVLPLQLAEWRRIQALYLRVPLIIAGDLNMNWVASTTTAPLEAGRRFASGSPSWAIGRGQLARLAVLRA